MNFGTLLDFLLVVFGFTMIVVIHEFGHFAAARWAGVRVLAFAVGFGQAVCSFRKGLGVRRGSSEQEYQKLVRSGRGAGVSATEYRLNMLPFGGYVKMLGQDDMDATSVSDAPDSFQMCRPWKRMVIISAGVVMNIITAMIMFVVVFGAGLKIDAPVLGYIDPGSPAATAKSLEDGVPDGLQVGDRVLRIDGDEVRSMNDIVVAAAFASRNTALRFEVLRENDSSPRFFDVMPVMDDTNHMMQIGVGGAAGLHVQNPRRPDQAKKFRGQLAGVGLSEVAPGMRLTKAGDITDLHSASVMQRAFAASGGAPVALTFADDTGKSVTVSVKPRADFSPGEIRLDKKTRPLLEHLAGMVPTFRVGNLSEKDAGYKAGLRSGDLFAKINEVDYPSVFQGVSEIRASEGKSVAIAVLRRNADGGYTRIELPAVPVDSDGRVGISIDHSAEESAMLAANPPEFYDEAGREIKLPENPLIGKRPCNIVMANGNAVNTLVDVRRELKAAVAPVLSGEKESVDVQIGAVPLDTPGEPAMTTITLTLGKTDAELLDRLTYSCPFGLQPFEPLETTLKAANPAQAVAMGFAETHRSMLQVYLTFARLFEGTVQVKDLKGPVGIAHVGTLIAGKGWVWLLFFCALISVNLAVVNFLPLPIVDGGQFLLIVYEQIVGKPAPIAFQNAAAIAGLVVFASLFLFITFHDISNLLGL